MPYGNYAPFYRNSMTFDRRKGGGEIPRFFVAKKKLKKIKKRY